MASRALTVLVLSLAILAAFAPADARRKRRSSTRTAVLSSFVSPTRDVLNFLYRNGFATYEDLLIESGVAQTLNMGLAAGLSVTIFAGRGCAILTKPHVLNGVLHLGGASLTLSNSTLANRTLAAALANGTLLNGTLLNGTLLNGTLPGSGLPRVSTTSIASSLLQGMADTYISASLGNATLTARARRRTRTGLRRGRSAQALSSGTLLGMPTLSDLGSLATLPLTKLSSAGEWPIRIGVVNPTNYQTIESVTITRNQADIYISEQVIIHQVSGCLEDPCPIAGVC